MTLGRGRGLRGHRMARVTRRVVGWACLTAVSLTAAPADAATNGLIAFQRPSTATIATIQDPDPATAGLVTAPATTAVVVPGLPVGSANPAWSRDGTMLAFSSTTGCRTGIAVPVSPQICVMNGDGTGLKPATQDPAPAIDPTLSPDGRRIAYSGFANGQPDIYVADIGGVPQRLTTGPARDQQAEWSPDGRDIAFESDRDGSFDIWLISPDARNERPITRDPEDETDAGWNPVPASRRLAFSSGRRGSFQRAIYAVDADGSGRAPLTPPGDLIAFPAWSPDGKRIAFSRSGSLVVMPATGNLPSGSTTPVQGDATDPAWAPLPVPSAKPAGEVTVDLPGKDSPAVEASPNQALPTGTRVDATRGEMTVTFVRPGLPENTPPSTVKVEGAAFRIADRTPNLLTVRIEPPDCPGAAVQAAKQKGKKPRTRVKGGRGGKSQQITNHGTTGEPGTEYILVETCRGLWIKVIEGTVIVKPKFGKRRNTEVRVRRGHTYFVAGALR